MKLLLIIFLFISSTMACKIDNCTVNDKFGILMNKVYPSLRFELSEDQTLTYWERLIDKKDLDYSKLESELVLWKAHENKKKDYKDRLKELKDIRLAANKCGISQPNMALFKKKLFKNLNEAKLSCLESKVTEIDSEILLKKQKLSKIKSARSFMKTYNCNLLLTEHEKAICLLVKERL